MRRNAPARRRSIQLRLPVGERAFARRAIDAGHRVHRAAGPRHPRDGLRNPEAKAMGGGRAADAGLSRRRSGSARLKGEADAIGYPV